jgi:CheY-like chemotaxis protein
MPAAEENQSAVRNWSKYTILIAEDVEINREIIEISLGETCVNMVSAENGKEAVDKFSAEPERFNLILMDVQMPVMDGLNATRLIRSMDNDHAKQIPIIAMTANAFKEDIDTCIAAGMNVHIAKPIAMDNFFAVLEKYLK